MRFVIIGSGAVGGYFGAKLQQAGQEVIFVARGKTSKILRDRGLILRHQDQTLHLPTLTTTTDLTTIGTADYVLISVKTWQMEAIVPQLPALAAAHTRFLTLQNGVEAAPLVAQQVGIKRTLGGLVRGFFDLEAPGEVRHVGVQPAIIFGQLDGTRTPEAEQLFQILSELGIHTELAEDIEARLWEKFLLVTTLSGIGAVTRSPIGEIRNYPPTWQMLANVMTEIISVAQAHGINLSADVKTRTLAFIETFPPEATTSMQRDLINGLPSELEAQTGAVVRLGREVGIPTPLNEFIYNSLILQEQRARG